MAENKVKKGNNGWVVIGIVVLALIVLGIGGKYMPKYRIIKNAKEKVANQLKDPSSVQFKNITIDENGLVVCGEVNGKNSMGGYVGYTQFYVLKDSVMIDTNEDEYKIAKRLCDKSIK